MTIYLYSKPFISVCGFKSRLFRCYSIGFHKKSDERHFGYWNFYYDGYFHHFGLGLFTLFWCHRPDMEYIIKHNKL